MNGMKFLFFVVLANQGMHYGEAPPPTIEPCWFGLPEKEISGADFYYFNTIPLGDCERDCSRDRLCLAFSFETNTFECRLHGNLETVSHAESEYYLKNCTVISGEPHTAICFNVSFVDHGPRTEGANVYTNFDSINMIECQRKCKNDEPCSGFTYDDNTQECFLSNDNIFMELTSFCFSCRFYEKTCQLYGSNATNSSVCSEVSFFDHGYQRTAMTFYNVVSSVNEGECYENCSNDYTCWGYTYNEENMMCSLSHDTIYIDDISCGQCRFYEKSCYSSSTARSDSMTTRILPRSSEVNNNTTVTVSNRSELSSPIISTPQFRQPLFSTTETPPQTTKIPPSFLYSLSPTNLASSSFVQVSQLSSGDIQDSHNPQTRTPPSSQPSSTRPPPTPQPLPPSSLSTSSSSLQPSTPSSSSSSSSSSPETPPTFYQIRTTVPTLGNTTARETVQITNGTVECVCICHSKNYTLREALYLRKKALSAETEKLSSFVRKQISATDTRQSSRVVGSIGAAIMFLMVGATVLPDVISVIYFISKVLRKCIVNKERNVFHRQKNSF